MKKKMKLNLSELKVQSFVTLNEDEKSRVIGAQASDTGAADLCCAIASGLDPKYCKDVSLEAYCPVG